MDPTLKLEDLYRFQGRLTVLRAVETLPMQVEEQLTSILHSEERKLEEEQEIKKDARSGIQSRRTSRDTSGVAR